MRLETPNKEWFIKVDSITSLVAYRLVLDAEAIAELKVVSAEARRFAEEVGDWHIGGRRRSGWEVVTCETHRTEAIRFDDGSIWHQEDQNQVGESE